MQRRIVPVLLAVVAALAVGCGEPEAFEAPTGGSGSEPIASPTPHDDIPHGEYGLEVTHYAGEMGVSNEEALRRLELQDDFGPLNGALEANERDTFAGAFLQHQPEFRFVVLFTRDGEETIRKYVAAGSELDALVEVRHVRYSLAELQEIRNEADEVLAQLENFSASSSTNVTENRVEYYVQNSAQVEQMLADAGLMLPAAVVVLGDGPPVDFVPPEQVPGIYIAIPRPTLGAGDYPDALLTGTLVLEGGCLLVKSDYGDGLLLPIWHHDHRLQVEGDAIEVVNGAGEVIARVGEPVWMGGAGGPSRTINQERLHYPIPESCPADGSWGVGGIDPLDQQPVSPTPVPDGDAPLGLHTVEWPVDLPGAQAILAAMPAELGEQLQYWSEPENSGRIVMGYGPKDQPGLPKLTITDLTTGALFPDYWTASDLMASQFTSPSGIALSAHGGMTWASEDTSHSGRIDRYDDVPVHALNWGSSDGRLLFTASAADYGQLELLIVAIVAARESK